MYITQEINCKILFMYNQINYNKLDDIIHIIHEIIQ